MTKLHFDPNQNYDCLMCGRGCRAGWDIPVEPKVVARLEKQPLVLRIIQEQGPVFRQVEDQVFIQNSKDCPNCRFLAEDQLCSIHREFGFEAKPATCQLFPFVMTQTPEGIFAGVTYYCTATRQNHGRNTGAHEADLRAQLERGAPINKVAPDGLVIHNRYYINYRDYLGIEKELLARAESVGLREALAQATLGLACTMAELPLLEDGVQAIGKKMPGIWEHPAMPPGSAVRQLRWLGQQQMCDYFKFSLERDQWDQVEAALYEGAAFALPHYGWSGTLNELDGLMDDRFDSEIDRYLAHLIWRKALVVHPPLLPSLLQLTMLPQFLKVLAGLIAHQRGHQEVADQDYWDALEETETYLVTHGRNRRVVNELGVESLISMLKG